MIPKLRAWKKYDSPEMFRDIAFIDFNKKLLGVNYKVSKLTTRLDIETLDKFILMQSTGLKDKNGIEIYEGDVVKVMDEDESTDFCDGGIGTINGLDELFMWYIDGEVENGLFDINSSYYIEVIGNIYENPELLEGHEK
ncbi:YopX family protein [Lactococcus lactis]